MKENALILSGVSGAGYLAYAKWPTDKWYLIGGVVAYVVFGAWHARWLRA